MPFESPYSDEVDTIQGDEILLRRVPAQWIDWEHLDDSGAPRITGGAFQDQRLEHAMELGYTAPAMSIGLNSIVLAHGETADVMKAKGSPIDGVAALTAAEVRDLEQGVMASPEQDAPWHGVVFSKNTPKRTESVRRRLAALAKWVVLPSRP